MHVARSPLTVVALLALSLMACAPGTRDTAPAAAPAAPAVAPAAKPAARQQAAQSPAGTNFAGKTVTLSVNYSAGGPTDTFARLLAQHLDRHIPGKPTLIVDNKPGAGGIVGMNHVYNVVRKDGLTVGVFTPHYIGQVLASEGVQFDESQFQHLGATIESQASMVHQSVARTARDMLRPSGEIIAAGLSPDSSKDMTIRTMLNLLGVKYKYVTGYPGNNDFRAAFQRNEVNLIEESLTGWFTGAQPLLKEGGAVPIGQRGIQRNGQVVRDPRLPDVPLYFELADELRGPDARHSVEGRALMALINTNAMSREIVYPPGVDPATVEVMRKAMSDLFADPEFLAAAEKLFGFQIEFLPGSEAAALAQRIIRESNEDAEAIAYLKRMAKERD